MNIDKNSTLENLGNEGYRFSEFSLETVGNCTVKDAMWNYKDAVAHMRHIHPLVRNHPLFVEDDKAGSLFLQSALGLTFPLIVLDLETRDNVQTSFTAFAFFVLVIENECTAVGQLKTKVKTTYHIGSPMLLRWMVPLIRWVLRKNYHNLTSTDIPMRERRGLLRTWGYEFLSDKLLSSYKRSLDLCQRNLDLKKQIIPLKNLHYDLNSLSQNGGETLLGRDDHLGLRIIRQGDLVSLFPRLCPHEGASLDKGICERNILQCPWHGKKIEPIALFDLSIDSPQQACSNSHSLHLKDGMLGVILLQAETELMKPFVVQAALMS